MEWICRRERGEEWKAGARERQSQAMRVLGIRWEKGTRQQCWIKEAGQERKKKLYKFGRVGEWRRRERNWIDDKY